MNATFPFRELPRARSIERWRMAGWVLAAWTLVGLFRAVDRYFSDPFQLHRLEFGLWEALAQSLFDPDNLTKPFHSVNTDINKRIRYVQ